MFDVNKYVRGEETGCEDVAEDGPAEVSDPARISCKIPRKTSMGKEATSLLKRLRGVRTLINFKRSRATLY